MKPVYLAAYHQSRFGKLGPLAVPEILESAVFGACDEIAADAADRRGLGGRRLQLHAQSAGVARRPGRRGPGPRGKADRGGRERLRLGGQAVLSVVQKLALGMGEVGIAIGYEKMRGDDGKVDGARVGEVLGYFSHPDERAGKAYVFPHLFAEVMSDYMREFGVSEEDLARIAVAEYAHAQHNPDAQMRGVELSLDQAMAIAGPNRYIVPGLPLKTYDCSQITDGYAALLLATGEGLSRLGVENDGAVRLAGWAQATDPLARAGRDVLRPAGALAAMATRLRDGRPRTRRRRRRRGPTTASR